jgi:hypothetical protein
MDDVLGHVREHDLLLAMQPGRPLGPIEPLGQLFHLGNWGDQRVQRAIVALPVFEGGVFQWTSAEAQVLSTNPV